MATSSSQSAVDVRTLWLPCGPTLKAGRIWEAWRRDWSRAKGEGHSSDAPWMADGSFGVECHRSL